MQYTVQNIHQPPFNTFHENPLKSTPTYRLFSKTFRISANVIENSSYRNNWLLYIAPFYHIASLDEFN
mgnify:FL=1